MSTFKVGDTAVVMGPLTVDGELGITTLKEHETVTVVEEADHYGVLLVRSIGTSHEHWVDTLSLSALNDIHDYVWEGHTE